MKSQLISLLGENVVIRVNMVAQILLYFVGAIGFYEARSFCFVSTVLSRIAFLKRFLFHSRTTTIVENMKTGERDSWASSATGLFVFTSEPRPPGTVIEFPQSGESFVIIEERREDLPSLFYFVAATVVLTIIIGIGNGILYWLFLPFIRFIKAFTVWSELALSWSAFFIPFWFLWHFLLGILFFALVYTLGVGTTLKSFLLIANSISERLTQSVYHFLLFLVFFIAGGVVIATTF